MVFPLNGDGAKFTQVAAGGHNLVLKDDGTVVVWGYNGAGARNVPGGLRGVAAAG